MRASFQLKTVSGCWKASWPAFRATLPFLLGYAAGMGLAFIPGISSMTDEERTFTLFAFGAVNGWLLCLLYGLVTGKGRRRWKRKRKLNAK